MIYLNNRSVIQTNKKNLYNRGFSLIELIIVIAIIAVLTGILAPSLLSYIHKARVAADWSNLRAYYSEIQADFTYTGKHDSNIETDLGVPSHWNRTEIHYPSGRTVKLKAGYYAITKNPEGNGYQICYAIIAKHQRVMKSISTAAFWFLVQDRMSIALLRFPFGWYSSKRSHNYDPPSILS